MALIKKNIEDLKFNPFDKIAKEWFLLTSGYMNDYNTMTCSWGFMGEMWGAPSVSAFVRESRNTFKYTENNELFSLCFFDEKYRDVLKYCGSHSGRDVDKAKETGITPVPVLGTVAFEEASMVIICKKKYSKNIDLDAFTDKTFVDKFYADNDIHKQYIGEIIGVYINE